MQRVVLADGDPELRHAIEDALRPWRIEVVVDPAVPPDVAAARTRADDRAAQFVVWREGDRLIVYDRASGEEERRAAHAGSFDPLEAAAAALTVKTMLRLPPPPPPDPAPATVIATTPPAVPPPGGPELRLSVGTGSRYERGLDGNVALRFALAASVRPWRDRGWRFGLLGDLGASADVAQAGFQGSWTNWAVLATAGWALARGPWELGLWAGAGLEVSALDGTIMGAPEIDHAALLALRGGPAVHYRLGRWTLGVMSAVELLPTTRTYTRPPPSAAQIFEIPPFGVVAEAVVGVDLAP